MRVLETKRCILRAATMDDAKDLFECYKKDVTVKYLPFDRHITIKDTNRFIRLFFLNNYKKGRIGHFVIVFKDTNKVIGNIGFNNISSNSREGEIGICINPDYWGKNISNELALAIIKYGFEDLNLEKIIAITFEENKFSQKPLNDIGFIYTETFKRKSQKFTKGYINCYKYELTKDGYRFSLE